MKDASGTAEEASPAPGYNDGLDDGALPETEPTAEEGRSVRRRHIKKIRLMVRFGSA